MADERWLTYREVGQLLGVGERAALNWVKEHGLPVAPGRPARVPLADVVAQAEALKRPLAPLPNDSEVTGGSIPNASEDFGSDAQLFGSAEPIEAAFTGTGDTPSPVALVPFAAVAAQLQGLADQLADLARRNEGLALEVGQLRERATGHEGQLAAKDETIATQRELVAHQAEILAEARDRLAELRRRTEVAEAERQQLLSRAEAAERERDALRSQAAPQPASEAATVLVMTETPEAQRGAGGLWRRLRRAFGGE